MRGGVKKRDYEGIVHLHCICVNAPSLHAYLGLLTEVLRIKDLPHRVVEFHSRDASSDELV